MSKKKHKPRPSQRPAYTESLAEFKFNQAWGEMMDIYRRHFTKQLKKGVADRRTIATIIERRDGVEERYAARKRCSRDVFGCLCQVLDGRGELMDLFSGDAVSTIPLIACGRIKELTLVDNGLGGTICQGNALQLTRRMGVVSKVSHLNIEIGAPDPEEGQGEPEELPTIEDVSLIDTGFSLPPDQLTPATESQELRRVSDAHRSGHILQNRVDLGDVLADLGQEPARLHIFDAPYYEHKSDPRAVREYITNVFLAEMPDWTMQDCRLVHPNSPVIYTRLVHE